MAKIPFFPIKKKSPAPEKNIVEVIYEFLSRSKNASQPYKRTYRNLARHLTNFSTRTGLPILTSSFTESVAEEFVEYLKSLNLMLPTVSSIFGKLITSIKRAEKLGYPIVAGFESIKIKHESSCAVYLTIDELERLNALTKISKEAQACRDRFLLGCFTALRISDYRALSVKENFTGNFIHVKTRKTGEPVIIPVHPIINDILKRNDNTIPPIPSQQAFGATIKRICKKAGITQPVLWERTVGKKIVRKRIPKYKLVSSHTARRSGATNMYLAGIPTARIMLLTGHKTEQAFFKYIRIEKEENAKILLEHEFFRKK